MHHRPLIDSQLAQRLRSDRVTSRLLVVLVESQLFQNDIFRAMLFSRYQVWEDVFERLKDPTA